MNDGSDSPVNTREHKPVHTSSGPMKVGWISFRAGPGIRNICIKEACCDEQPGDLSTIVLVARLPKAALSHVSSHRA